MVKERIFNREGGGNTMITGKYSAQTYTEMRDHLTEKKEKELAINKGNSIYKKESGEYQEEKLRELVAAKTAELVEAVTKKKVSLENIEDVKQRTVVYLRACEETGTFPSSLGLARSLGYSDRALRSWRNNKPNTETAQWLEMFNDLCADVLNQSALKNNANTIVSIFLNKAMYGFRETNELVVTPNNFPNEELEYSVDEIRRRYLVEEDDNDTN